ncbi:hypothetical protein J2129_002780 [Methanofollis sp. W23]|nr:hypothetical protein [Methanofollis sp. W23]
MDAIEFLTTHMASIIVNRPDIPEYEHQITITFHPDYDIAEDGVPTAISILRQYDPQGEINVGIEDDSVVVELLSQRKVGIKSEEGGP